ncbi:MAG: hypothetical protein K6U87_09795 [Firmicutes bacterium]|nr:hypothetical protein [Bacillota bacterium]
MTDEEIALHLLTVMIQTDKLPVAAANTERDEIRQRAWDLTADWLGSAYDRVLQHVRAARLRSLAKESN